MASKQEEVLFPEIKAARYGENDRHRRLFLPTSLQGEFLTEVFGEGLGYVLFSANTQQWHLEREYSVNGGTADGAVGLFESGRS